MKVATILGARPQFIKASVVSHAIAGSTAITEVVVHTGQHFDADMSAVFFSELGMAAPKHQLGIHGGTHGAMTGRMLCEIEAVLMAERPDAVIVYGDTNSTLAGALAAVKLQIPVAHVEAGLRSFNMAMPEEINRVLTDRVSRWLFTPTAAAAQHLAREGLAGNRVVPVGDVMYDVALHYGSRASADSPLFTQHCLEPGGYVLATIHRAENTDDPHRLGAVVVALEALAREVRVVWPLHPRTRAALHHAGLLDTAAGRLTILDPVGYLDMVRLEKHAALIATDSGGVQKEAFFHQVPCVTLRDETEWVELVEAGWNRLAPPSDPAAIVGVLRQALGTRGEPVTPYGHGDAATRIVLHLAGGR
jgi:UDP-GlcNAc3NAcA epimerase